MNKVAKGSLIFTISTVLSKGISFFLLPIYLAHLTLAQYGTVGYIQVIINLMFNVVILGFHGSQTRLIHDKNIDQGTLLFTLNIFLVLESLLCFAIFWIGGGLLFHDTLGIEPSFPPLLALGIVVLMIFNQMSITYFTAHKNFLKAAIIETSIFLTSAALIILLVVFQEKGINGYFIAIIIAQAISALIYGASYLKHFKPKFKFKYLKESLLLGVPTLFHLLGLYLNNSADRFVLAKYLSMEDLGIYNLGYTLASVMSYMIIAINKAWTPTYFSLMNETNGKVNTLINNYYDIWVLGLGFATLIGISIIPFVIEWFAPDIYTNSIGITIIILLAYYNYGIYTYFVNSIFFFKKNKFLPFLTLLSGLINVFLNIIYIPLFGIMAAAVSTLISFLVLMLCVIVFSRYFFKQAYSYNFIIYFYIVSLCSAFVHFGIEDNYRSLLMNSSLIIVSIGLVYYMRKKPLTKWLNDKFSIQ
ncbi:oligosaccharide flippase family protein [Reichenbachiella carrageenanivorans]|uniref:Oligosaccharide flippase family protein n=1 Tax=Reichenbachiella carrageenanivorans TaxID=2979869 RepID=A0ABY6D9N8_9BACT|nr:oligosaccharide flippase family protein [Reichenbachiella carrageenanivorans]UXX80600.1 oligosaccharide flippase family protein [Reichenbachiella carrageenanivorans]